jgi:hypothetical protein
MSHYCVLIKAIDPLDGETIYISEYVKAKNWKKYQAFIRRYYPEHKWLEENKVEVTEKNPFQPCDERSTIVTLYGVCVRPILDTGELMHQQLLSHDLSIINIPDPPFTPFEIFKMTKEALSKTITMDHPPK